MALRSERTPVVVHCIGVGARFEGVLRFSGRLVIQGRLEGMVIADPLEGSLVEVTAEGEVDGSLQVESARIAGRVTGPVTTTQLLELVAGAHLGGDVRYTSIEIQTGAVVKGALIPLTEGAEPLMGRASLRDA